MSNSFVWLHGRDDALYVIDPEALPHFDEHPPVFDIVIAVINAGYKGVVVDEKRLANGRFLLCLSVIEATPEGNVIKNLVANANNGKQLPSVEGVLAQLKTLYEEIGVSHE